MKPWIGVDLDGTLAEYKGWKGSLHIGEPVPKMVERVKAVLAEGHDVKIFTARVAQTSLLNNSLTLEATENVIRAWCVRHLGCELPITCIKDFGMIMLWDDRCKQVTANTGEFVEDTVAHLTALLTELRTAAADWATWVATKTFEGTPT